MNTIFHHIPAASAGLLAAILTGGAASSGQASAASEPPASLRVFADTLMTNTGRPAGTALQGLTMADGTTLWRANKGVVVQEQGATSDSASGAHHEIPPVAGTIRLKADICATGSGFTGLALGRGDLSGNFWVNLEILFYANTRRCGLMIGKQDLSSKLSPAAKLIAPTNRLEILLNTTSRSLTLRVNDAIVMDNAPLPPTARLDNITSAGFRFNEPVVAGQPSVSAYRAETVNLVTAGLEPIDLGMVFVIPDRESSLQWRATLRGEKAQVPYIIRGYDGAEKHHADATVNSEGLVVVAHTFRRGYHEIVFPEANQTFGILALEPHAGPADPFFGIDSALTQLEQRLAVRTNMVAVMKRSGIAVARERMNQASINPKTDVFNWETGRNVETTRNIYRAAGVKVLEMMWGVTKDFKPGLNNKYPQNLINASESWSRIDSQFGSSWAAYEIGNEPDLDLPAMPADQYVATIKAAAFASDRIAPRQPVIGGVFATVPPGPYFDTAVANGILDCSDALSFHQYDRAPSIQGQVQAYRDFLAANGHAGLPLWLTECGHFWALGPDRPPRDQDAESAREISAKAVEARACGIHSFFPFVMVFYEEGGSKSFSMFGREVTPLRSFAAYAWCITALSDRDYCGDLRTDDPNIRLARVFKGKDDAQVAVIYSDKLDASLRVRLPAIPTRITGADGRELQMNPDGTMPLPDALGYAWYGDKTLVDVLIRDTPASRLYATSKQTLPARASASPVVLQFPYSADLGQISKRAYHLSKEKADALTLTVRLQNMGNTPLTITPTLHLPEPDSRAVLHAPVTVGPRSIGEATWTVDASKALDVCEIRHLRVTAECKEAPGILPLALPMLVDGELDEILTRYPKQEPLPIAEIARWEMRAGNGKHAFSSSDGKTLRLDMTFTTPGGAWIFPYFTMPAPIDPKTFCGIVIRARIMKQANNNMIILVEEKERREIRANDLFVADGQWHSVYVPFDQLRYFTPGLQNEPLRLDRISTLSIGCVSRELVNTLEVSDLILVGKNNQ